MGRKTHILLLGPVTNVNFKLVGGATISFGYLVDYLEKSGENFTLINTHKYPIRIRPIRGAIHVLLRVLQHIWKTDVIFLNSSRGGTKNLMPLLYILARVFGKKLVFRPFGGNIKEYTASYSSWRRWIFERTVLKCDILFLQTEALMKHYEKYDVNTFQLPTSRNQPPEAMLRGKRPYQRRFIYLGFVREDKGMEALIAARQALGDDHTLHIYGIMVEKKYEEKFQSVDKDLYKGVLSKAEVLPTLREYDVLILPTYYGGEGYPGSIIEAYSLGLPVITTRWKSIPEIVRHGYSGRLIDIQSNEQLLEAMHFFNESNYGEYSSNARQYFQDRFSTDQVNGQVLYQIKALLDTGETALKTN
ncbi:MAG: glycosyltransferase family 4 protein [Bacteroidota bacterium]